MSTGLITLLTDFGDVDGFVGIMKGVIYGINPKAMVIDISHKVERQNIASGAFVLNTAYRYFPAGTIHVVVIDPGVGSERRILCVAANRQYFLAPDNGVLGYIYHNHADIQAIDVKNDEYFLPEISRTFHGRDIFAPVAAHLSLGLSPEKLGPTVRDYVKGQVYQITESPGIITGRVVYVDQFGNLISNIPFTKLRDKLDREIRIVLKDHTISGLSFSYSQGREGEPIALISSSGFLEVACNHGNAHQQLSCGVGEEIRVLFNQ